MTNLSSADIEKLVEDHIDLIAVNGESLAQAKTRSAKFLVAESILSSYLKELQKAIAQFKTVSTASYAQVMKGLSSKKVTENKIEAEAHPDYSRNRQSLEEMEAEANWVKTHMKIFDNAHVMYRQFANE